MVHLPAKIRRFPLTVFIVELKLVCMNLSFCEGNKYSSVTQAFICRFLIVHSISNITAEELSIDLIWINLNSFRRPYVNFQAFSILLWIILTSSNTRDFKFLSCERFFNFSGFSTQLRIENQIVWQNILFVKNHTW